MENSPGGKAAVKIIGDIKKNIETVIVGKGGAVDLLLICLLCGGHALIEDVPGVGKTSLAASLAASVSCGFRRVQFTPDVLPSDVTGFTMYHPVTGERQFIEGAVMSNILLADELNRTSPKTQSALLQAMQEGVVTVDGETRPLPRPFMVCATQNPVELAGTYPLPEAQLDRFLLRIAMGYPERGDELTILERNKRGGMTRTGGDKPAPKPAASARDVLAVQSALENVICSGPVMSYIVDIARRTRAHKDVLLGVSPRGSVALMKASMGRALLSGREYVLPDDVQAMAKPALCHRLILRVQAYTQNRASEDILSEVLHMAPVPAVSGP
ncbi:MAG: MoxR family ATPase [Oscillospiraceae bacterium]|nr:MoxR family ATPase [Oscillospiraceae bacterium]